MARYRSRIQPYQPIQNDDFGDVFCNGYANLKIPTSRLSNIQKIMDTQDEYITDFGVAVRHKSCLKMKL